MTFEISLPRKNVVYEKCLDQMWDFAGMDDLETLIDNEGKYSIDNFFEDVYFNLVEIFEKTSVGNNLKNWFNSCNIVINENKVNSKCHVFKIYKTRGMRLVDRELLRQFILVAFDHLGPPNQDDWKEKCLLLFNNLIVQTPFLIAIKRLLKDRIRAIVRSKYACLKF